MAISKYGPKDWRAGFRHIFGNGEGWAQAVTIVTEAGVPVTQPAGPAALGQAAAAASSPVTLSTENLRVLRPTATHRLLGSAATTNLTLVSAAARSLHTIIGNKPTVEPCFLKIYDKATAPTAADTPIMTFDLLGLGRFEFDLKGHPLAAGLGYAITAAAADNDATAVAAGDVTGLNISFSV